MAVQFHLPPAVVVVVPAPADVCRCSQKKEKKKRGKALSSDAGGWVGGVGGVRGNRSVARRSGDGSLVTAAAGRKRKEEEGEREGGREASCRDGMGIKGLEVGRKGSACERQRLWRLEHMRRSGVGWLAGFTLTGRRSEEPAGGRYRSLNVEFIVIATLIPFDRTVGMGAPRSCAATGLCSERSGSVVWEKVQKKRDKKMIIRKEEKQTP